MATITNRPHKALTAGAAALVAFALAIVGALCAAMPAKATAATLQTDLISFISVNGPDAVAPDIKGAGTLESPYEGTIATSVGSEELAYLSVKFIGDNAEGVAAYLVQTLAPASTDAINLPMTNVDGRCNSDAPLNSDPGTYTLWVFAKASAAATTGEVFKIELTITPKTAEPIFEEYTVQAEPGDQTAQFTVVNADDYDGDVAVALYTSEGGLLGAGYAGAYANGTLTVTFPAPVTGQTLLRAKFTAPGAGGSDLSAVMTVYPHATTAPAAPTFISPVMANPGNASATVPLTGPAYSGWVEVDVYASDGYIAGGVAPTYDAQTNTITLAFDPALTTATDYTVSMVVDGLESPTTPLEVLPYEGPATETVAVYRFYNPALGGAHLFTADKNEIAVLPKQGWIAEGARFLEYANAQSGGVPVIPLYNPNNSDHFFTTNASEARALTTVGWIDEGVKWYGAQDPALPVYRLYNPHQTFDGGLGNHLWTALDHEKNVLITLGWSEEGIGWHAVELV